MLTRHAGTLPARFPTLHRPTCGGAAAAAAPPPAAGLPARRTRPELYRLSYEALIDTVLEWQSAVCPEPG